MAEPVVCILLSAKFGVRRRERGSIKDIKHDVEISKGELLFVIPPEDQVSSEDGTPTHNFCMYDDPAVSMYDSGINVSLPLKTTELDYLEAVESPSIRAVAYHQKKKLKWIMDLKVGDSVQFDSGENLQGRIRYCGPIPRCRGVMFGIEIMNKNRGKGTSDGQPYFFCGHNNAVYVPMDKIIKKGHNFKLVTKTKKSFAPTQDTSDITDSKKDDSDEDSAKGPIKVRFLNETITSKEENSEIVSVFAVGDRVVVQTLQEKPILGSVRWAGPWKSIEAGGIMVPMVGIETDSKIDVIKDFPDLHVNLTGRYVRFKVPSNHSRVYLPEQLVLHIDEYTKQKQEDNTYEVQEAKKWGLSVEEYRLQKELLEKAKRDHDAQLKKEQNDIAVVGDDSLGQGQTDTQMLTPEKVETSHFSDEVIGMEIRKTGDSSPQTPTQDSNPGFNKYDGDTFPESKHPTTPPSSQRETSPVNDTEFARLRSELELQIATKKQLNALLEVKMKEIENLKQNYLKRERQYHQHHRMLQQEQKDMQWDYQELQQNQQNLQKINKTLQQNHLRLQEDHQKMQEDNQTLNEEHQKLQQNHEEVLQDYQKIQKDLNTLQVMCEKLQADYHSLQQDHKKLQQIHAKVLQDDQMFQKDHHTLQQDYHTLQRDHHTLQQECQKQKQDLNAVRIDHQQLQIVLEKSEQDHHSAQQEYQKLQQHHKKEQRHHLQLQAVLEQKEREHQNEKAHLEEQIRKLQESWKVSHKDVNITKEELGRGGWGVIQVGLFREQRVAVKQLYTVIMTAKNLALMHREINTMSKLRHPNLLLFIGAVLDHPSRNPLIITEIMDTSLRDLYEKEQLTSEMMKLTILRDVAAGLNYLHCLDDPIIHRDVSSANVLLESKGPDRWKAKLSDFGSANFARNATSKVPGAAVYGAPECFQIAGRVRKKQTTMMDVFSFGVLLCEIMTCRFPDPDQFLVLLQNVATSSPPIAQLIRTCIEEEAENRPTIRTVIQQLDERMKLLTK